MSKNLGYYTYTGVTEVTAGNTLPLTNTVRQRGNCIRLRNNAIVLRSVCGCNGIENAAGYYTVSVNTTLTATAAGTITVSLYQDGSLVQGAVQSATVAAENNIQNFSFTAPVRVFCGQGESTLTVYVNSQNVNTMNVAVEVVKE
uniref:Uncharacterized protein n=1 Tax=Siphoviridae sp. ctsxw88 TaxID=2825701 RepID=A0A8S5PI58_9CAUD|nr:MAG TPA: hypothetical protein [Siphoviridae sp. ctsxw88]